MSRLTVLEYIRDASGTWNLPERHMARLREEFGETTFLVPADRAEADARLPEADVVLGYAVRADNFATARNLRWIQITSAGVPASVLFPALVESPVLLTNGRGFFSVAMAEHALGMMLTFARKLHLSRDAQHARTWTQREQERAEPPFMHLQGSTLGLIGFGSINRALAERARALGMRVLAVRRHPSDDAMPADEQWGIERLGDLLEASDWVVLAPPLTDETRGMIGARELRRMRRSAVLVNLGRGALVDEPALIGALEAGTIAGAALDVVAEEPLPESSPLWSMPQVLITPHTSGIGPGLWERAIDLFARNLHAFSEGRPLENVVDKHAGY